MATTFPEYTETLNNDTHDYPIDILSLYASDTIDSIVFWVSGMVNPTYENLITINHWEYTRRMIEINNQLYYSALFYANDRRLPDYYTQYVLYHNLSPGHLNTIIISTFLIYQH